MDSLLKLMKILTLFVVMCVLVLFAGAAAKTSVSLERMSLRGIDLFHHQVIPGSKKHATGDRMPNAYKKKDWVTK